MASAPGATSTRACSASPHTLRERVDRFHEFTALLDRLLREDHVDHAGDHYRAVDARTLPGPVQRPRIPFVIAANGPRSLRLAAEHGQGWVTTGGAADTLEDWWSAVAELAARLDDALVEAGRETSLVRPLPLLDSSPVFALGSVDLFEDMAGRADELGFTDVITHWPRPEGVYAGERARAGAARPRGCSPRGRRALAEREEREGRARRLGVEPPAGSRVMPGTDELRGVAVEHHADRGLALVGHEPRTDHRAVGLWNQTWKSLPSGAAGMLSAMITALPRDLLRTIVARAPSTVCAKRWASLAWRTCSVADGGRWSLSHGLQTRAPMARTAAAAAAASQVKGLRRRRDSREVTVPPPPAWAGVPVGVTGGIGRTVEIWRSTEARRAVGGVAALPWLSSTAAARRLATSSWHSGHCSR